MDTLLKMWSKNAEISHLPDHCVSNIGILIYLSPRLVLTRLLLRADAYCNMHVTDAQGTVNRTTSVPKSVLRYVLDKVQYLSLVSLL